MKFRRSFLALAIIGVVAYLNSWWNPFIWDDEQFIFKNVFVTEFRLPELLSQPVTAGGGVISNYYRPLTSLTFAIDWAVWGGRPFGFHLTNTALHVGTGLTLFALFKLLGIGRQKPDHETPEKWWLDPAWWVSAVFLVHPIQTEAVTYINSRGDSLYAFCLSLSLLFFTKVWLKQQSHARNFFLTIAFFVAALLSKEIALAGAGLFGLLSFLIVFKDVLTKKNWRQTLNNNQLGLGLTTVLIAIAICYLGLRATIWNFDNSFDFYDGSGQYAQNLDIRLLTFSKIHWMYLKFLFLPWPLHMERDTALVTTAANPWTWSLTAFWLAAAWLGWREISQKHTYWIWLGAGWWWLMLLPVSGIIPINGLLYEHWLYLPMVGWWLLCYRILDIWLVPHLKLKLPQPFLLSVGAFWLAILLLLTWRQNYLWGDHIRFYTYILQFNQTARVHNNLAMAYDQQGEHHQAISHYQAAIEITDSYPQVQYNLGNAYSEIGENNAATAAYNRAIEIDPSFVYPYLKLAEQSIQNEDWSTAATNLDTITKLVPNRLDWRVLYGQILYQTGEYDQARQVLNQAYRDSNFNPQIKKVVDEFEEAVSTQSAKRPRP